MSIGRFLSFIIFLLLFSTCKKGSEREFPKVVDLKTLQKTDFALTLESPLTPNKNSVYAASFLLAWDELRTFLKQQIKIPSSASGDLNLVNRSKSFLGTLAENEYDRETSIDGNLITARAFFNKSLPLAHAFKRQET